jgi:hypothetical protein
MMAPATQSLLPLLGDDIDAVPSIARNTVERMLRPLQVVLFPGKGSPSSSDVSCRLTGHIPGISPFLQ